MDKTESKDLSIEAISEGLRKLMEKHTDGDGVLSREGATALMQSGKGKDLTVEEMARLQEIVPQEGIKIQEAMAAFNVAMAICDRDKSGSLSAKEIENLRSFSFSGMLESSPQPRR